jgi:hypothetical protein
MFTSRIVAAAVVPLMLLAGCANNAGEVEQLAVDLCHERVKSQAWVSETVRFVSTTEPENVDGTWIMAGTVVFPHPDGGEYENDFTCKVTAGSDSKILNDAEVVRVQ